MDTEIGDDPIDEGRPPDELNLVVPGADFGWLHLQASRTPVAASAAPPNAAPPAAASALFPPGATPTSVAFAPWAAEILLRGLVGAGRGRPGEDDTTRDNTTGVVEPFMEGLRNPQHLLPWPDGSLLVSEFGTGIIYRVVENR